MDSSEGEETKLIAKYSALLMSSVLAYLAGTAVTQGDPNNEGQPLPPIEMRSPRSAPILTSTLAFDAGLRDPILVSIEMESNGQLLKSIVVQYRKAKLRAPVAIYRCIDNPDPGSVTVILGYVDPNLPGVESLANVQIVVDSHQRVSSVPEVSEPPYVGFQVEFGKVVGAWMLDTTGKERDIDLEKPNCKGQTDVAS
jgi:hypothetical protein